MALVAGDLKMFLTGGASNADPNLSLGGVTSSVQFVDDTLQNLFGNVSAAEALVGSTKYRALALKNTSGTSIAYGTYIHISEETPSTYTTVEIAYDATGTQDIVDENTAPVGLIFSAPLDLATAIALGDIAVSGVARIWFKRIVTAGAVAFPDEGQVTVTAGNAP